MTAVSTSLPVTAAPAAGFSPRRFFNDLRIGSKILVLVALAGALTMVVGFVGQRALVDLRKSSDQVGNVTTQKAVFALTAKYDYDTYRRLILRAALATSVDAAQQLATKADAALVTTRADIDAFTAMGTDEDDKAVLPDLLANVAATDAVWVNKIKPAVLQPNSTKAQHAEVADVIGNEFGPTADKVAAGATELATATQGETKSATISNRKKADQAIAKLWGVTIVGLILLVLLGLGLARLISS